MRTITDDEGLALARLQSELSLDPSTKTGCVLVYDDMVVGSGFNGLPPGVTASIARLEDRPTRLALTVHAEVAALLGVDRGLMPPRFPLDAYVWPWPPCSACAGALVVAGVRRVVATRPTAAQYDRWRDSFRWMETIFEEAGVELVMVDPVAAAAEPVD